MSASLAAHGCVAVALILATPIPPALPQSAPIAVDLVKIAPPPPPKPPPSPAPKRFVRVPAAAHVAVRRPKPLPAPATLAAAPAPTSHGTSLALTDSELAGAASADGGGGGGGAGCDMARRVQNALRKDRLAQAAVAEASHGEARAIWVWRGDWIQDPAQDGKGLAAVREAMMWEIAFAPPACRAERVRGPILFSMNAPGAARLAVGSGEWRWADLLGGARGYR